MAKIPEKALPTRIIALDYGMARIGIAMSDERGVIAMPLTTLKAEKKTAHTIDKLLSELQIHQQQNRYTISAIVVGMPLLMSGKKGLLADEVHYFVEQLRQVTALPVLFWDERLTSVQADRSLREGQLTRKKRAQKSDIVAATIILQNYLDFLASRPCND
jgi:putative Holliday junction resolvase